MDSKGCKIRKQPEGHFVAWHSMQGRMVLLKKERAIRFLEMFANMCLYFQDRLIEEGVIFDKVIDGFGFTAFRSENDNEVILDEEHGTLFLMNYFHISRFLKDNGEYKNEKCSVPFIIRPNPRHLKSKQATSLVLNAVINCFANYFVQRKDSSAYNDWLNKLRMYASIYTHELMFYRKFLLAHVGTRGINELKSKYKLPIEYILSNKE